MVRYPDKMTKIHDFECNSQRFIIMWVKITGHDRLATGYDRL